MKTASVDWLSIREASRLLGVHIGTLREWADAGTLPSYRTPGGHRRFSRIGLERFLDQQTKNPAAVDATLSQTEQALRRMREELHSHPHPNWLSARSSRPDEMVRAQQREFGQALLSCVVGFVESPDERERLLDEGRSTAREYGRALIANGVSAGSAARATIHFRQLILKTVLEVHLGSRTGDEEDARLFQRVSTFLDEILLAIVEAYP